MLYVYCNKFSMKKQLIRVRKTPWLFGQQIKEISYSKFTQWAVFVHSLICARKIKQKKTVMIHEMNIKMSK